MNYEQRAAELYDSWVKNNNRSAVIDALRSEDRDVVACFAEMLLVVNAEPVLFSVATALYLALQTEARNGQ